MREKHILLPGTQPLPLSPDSRSLLSPQGKTRWVLLSILWPNCLFVSNSNNTFHFLCRHHFIFISPLIKSFQTRHWLLNWEFRITPVQTTGNSNSILPFFNLMLFIVFFTSIIIHDHNSWVDGCIHLQHKRGTSFVCLALPPHHLFAYDATQKIPNLFFYTSSERPFVNKKTLS